MTWTAAIVVAAASAYAGYLPADVRPAALAALRDAVAASGPAVTFQSAESTFVSDTPIVNQVRLASGPRFDVWLMRQRQKDADGADPGHWSFVGLLVDRAAQPSVAYYLEFAPRPVPAGELPEPIPPLVPCYRCHPGGPRTLRPEGPVQDERRQMAAWNERIAAAGVVRTYEPPGVALRLTGDVENEALPLPACRGCHDAASGVRAELRRQHFTSILFLTTHGKPPAMPLEDRLTPAEMTCLVSWVKARPLPGSCLAAAPAAPAAKAAPATKASPVPSPSELVLDSDASHLAVSVATTVSRFEVSQLGLAGNASCSSPGDCAGTFHVDVTHATTGIRVRDRHLAERVLETARFPEAALTVHTGGAHLSATLRLRGVERPVALTADCHDTTTGLTCENLRAPLDLRDYGIDPPHFLGLTVRPEVLVHGTVTLRRS